MAGENDVLEGTNQERSTNIENVADAIGTSGGASASNIGHTGAIRKPVNGHFGQQNITASTKTDRYAAEYNMNHKFRGLALIFNHEHFNVGHKPLNVRTGTNVDRDSIARCLKLLDFDVKIYNDCRLSEIKGIITDAAKQDHSDNDCILITILSHGEMGNIYSKDAEYKFEIIWNPFTAQNCPTLAGKPKLFFIQACQGDRLDPGIKMKRTTETDGQSSMNYKIPIHADFLFAYSTIPGFYSWRNTANGSFYIQSLCAELESNGKILDIHTLLTYVAQRVAIDFESFIPGQPEMHQHKQIPCFTSMLTRLLRFNDKALPIEK